MSSVARIFTVLANVAFFSACSASSDPSGGGVKSSSSSQEGVSSSFGSSSSSVSEEPSRYAGIWKLSSGTGVLEQVILERLYVFDDSGELRTYYCGLDGYVENDEVHHLEGDRIYFDAANSEEYNIYSLEDDLLIEGFPALNFEWLNEPTTRIFNPITSIPSTCSGPAVKMVSITPESTAEGEQVDFTLTYQYRNEVPNIELRVVSNFALDDSMSSFNIIDIPELEGQALATDGHIIEKSISFPVTMPLGVDQDVKFTMVAWVGSSQSNFQFEQIESISVHLSAE